MNQDGLENFFGCLRSCCQNSSSLIAIHFRSAYVTTFVNNLASAHSIKSNCEQDLSQPLLTDMHEFFLNDKRCKKDTDENDDNFNLKFSKNDGYEYDYDPISINIKFSDMEVNSIYDETLSNAASIVCDKVLKATICRKCRETLETTTSQGQEIKSDHQNTINHPSDLFIKNYIHLANAIDIILPEICEQKFLKKKLREYIDDDNIDIDRMGCSKHHEEVEVKFKECCLIYLIISFCKKINDHLSGKNLILARNANIIETSAHKFFQKKKHIGKYSEIFKIQN